MRRAASHPLRLAIAAVAAALALAFALDAAPLAAAGPAAEGPLAAFERESRGALAAAGFARRELAARAGRLVYWTGGEGPGLLLLHGSGDQAGTWARVAPSLAAARTVVIPDLPGHGESHPATGPLPMTALVEGLEDLVASGAAGERFAVAGNSLGAWLAFLLASREPARVERVVAVNGGPILGEPSGLSLTPRDREEARRLMAALRDPASPPLADAFLDELVARAPSGPTARMLALLPDMLAWLLDGRLGEIATPVVLLWGESDRLMPVGYAEKMAAQLPAARLTRLSACGHLPQNECPQRLVEALRAALAGEEPGAPEAGR